MCKAGIFLPHSNDIATQKKNGKEINTQKGN